MSKNKSGHDNGGSLLGFHWRGEAGPVLKTRDFLKQKQPVSNCKTVNFILRRIKIAQTSSAQSGDSNRWLQSWIRFSY